MACAKLPCYLLLSLTLYRDSTNAPQLAVAARGILPRATSTSVMLLCFIDQGFARLWEVLLATGRVWQWRSQELYFDTRDSHVHHIQLACSGIGKVDHAPCHSRATIIDADLDRPPIGEIGHQGVRTKGRRPVCRDQLITIENLAARRAPSMPLPAIPGGQAVLDTQARRRVGGCGRRGSRATRTGRYQTGNEETLQQRTRPPRPSADCARTSIG